MGVTIADDELTWGHVRQTVLLQGKVPGDWCGRFRARLFLTSRSFRFLARLKAFSGGLLTAHDCKYRESLARLKKNENSDNLSEKPLWGTIFEKNIFNFQESIVFEKMKKNENSGFYLINYAKIRVKMTYFIASVPTQDSKL